MDSGMQLAWQMMGILAAQSEILKPIHPATIQGFIITNTTKIKHKRIQNPQSSKLLACSISQNCVGCWYFPDEVHYHNLERRWEKRGNGNKDEDGMNGREKKRRNMWLHVFPIYLLCIWTGLADPSAFFYDTEKIHCSLGEKGGKQRVEEVGRKRSRGTAFYIRLFISLLPSVIRNGRTLTPKHCASFQFHLAHNCLRKRAILQCPERHKKNYSCTKEFNCIVPSPVPTKGYARISNEDGHPSDKGYF